MSAQLVDSLHAAGAISDLDRGFARLMARLTGSGDGALTLAAALVSRASVEGDICLDLARLAGGSILANRSGLKRSACSWVNSISSPGKYLLPAKRKLFTFGRSLSRTVPFALGIFFSHFDPLST